MSPRNSLIIALISTAGIMAALAALSILASSLPVAAVEQTKPLAEQSAPKTVRDNEMIISKLKKKPMASTSQGRIWINKSGNHYLNHLPAGPAR